MPPPGKGGTKPERAKAGHGPLAVHPRTTLDEWLDPLDADTPHVLALLRARRERPRRRAAEQDDEIAPSYA